ncbi:cyclic nucleotide-binding protein [Leclercia sp. LSNIH6]|nr:cyclic nucleotide-binding protein [Leclercia sp. LSNIH7]POU76817.1 cyclic nucleotide-binding protein [Leclercia sp. LSNIH6]POW52236.1 cyclic nucleotide-binding protein [Leclercia sp. LSNIH8]
MNTRMTAVKGTPTTSSLAFKPFADIEKLIAHLRPFTETVTINKGDVVHYYDGEIRQCWLLLSGSVALHRRGDGVVLNSESGPFLIGVSSQLCSEHLYARALEDVEVAPMPLTLFNQIVANEGLWEPFSRLLIYTVSRIYEHCSQISQMSAYDIIRLQLVELLQEPDSVRLNTTAAAYIKSRTYLSRSGIMRILSELRTGGYIAMQRGVLIDIHHLPLKY